MATNWIWKVFPNIPMKTLIMKIENKTCEMGPQEKTSSWQSIFINRKLNPLFHHPVLLLILNHN